MDPVKILYVDDEIINLELMEICLSGKFTILTAENGFEGLRTLENNQDIRVVLSDMKMPQMTGIEFISKARIKYPKIYYYILTGYEITSEIQQALNEGVIRKYYRKPLNMNEIEQEMVSITSA